MQQTNTMAIPGRGAVARVTLASALALSFALGVSGASAGRIDAPGHDANHCINAFGIDLNELYGVSDQFRNGDCRVVSAGEHWVIGPLLWVDNHGADSVYPDGYVASHPEPIDDFVSKLVSMTVVIDGGTKGERVHVFSPGEAVRNDIDLEQDEPGTFGAPFPTASIMPRMPQLSVGDHTWEVFIELGADHCDGFSTDPNLSCLPSGELAFTPVRPLTVSVPGR